MTSIEDLKQGMKDRLIAALLVLAAVAIAVAMIVCILGIFQVGLLFLHWIFTIPDPSCSCAAVQAVNNTTAVARVIGGVNG